MMNETSSSYRASMFDGEPGLSWLRPGWRGLRLYGQKAKAAIEMDDIRLKAEMISRADQLLTVMSGILDTNGGNSLGLALMRIYDGLRQSLLKANVANDRSALDDFDEALLRIDQDFTKLTEPTAERR
jgi:flagellar biosynthetic protein FliS